jgi:hypothetical protein
MALRPAGCLLIELPNPVEHRLTKGMADELQGERQGQSRDPTALAIVKKIEAPTRADPMQDVPAAEMAVR